MKDFFLPSLLELSQELGRLAEYFQNHSHTDEFTEENKKNNSKVMRDRVKDFSDLELHMCRMLAERIAAAFETKKPNEMVSMLEDLKGRMQDECSLRVFMTLSLKEADLVFPKEALFGLDVGSKFPTAAFEIEEAGKCLGLSRSTAAVFHCMRVMEIGIAATARCLGIPDPVKPAARNWGTILKSFKDEFDRRSKLTLPAKWANPDKAFFEEIHASLDAVRNPWRNATMHVESKYNEEEAEHIFIAVRAFMKKLSSRLDEKGEPKCL